VIFSKLAQQGLPVISGRSDVPFVIEPEYEPDHNQMQLRLFERELSPVEMLDIIEAFDTLSSFRDFHPAIEAAILCLTGNAVMYGVEVANIATKLNVDDIAVISCYLSHLPLYGGMLMEGEW
jgi:hypothetical protein